jgi:fructokinase
MCGVFIQRSLVLLIRAPLQVLCAGEALIDLVAQTHGQLEPCLGGAVYNLARALALQGVEVGYLNPLSSDFYGQALRAGLISSGVQVLETLAVDAPSSLAIARIDAQGKADYSFYREGVADRQITAQRLNALSQVASIACTGCLALSPDDAMVYLPWLAKQKQVGRLVAIDINTRASVVKDSNAYKVNILKALCHADIVKASDGDLAFLGLTAPQVLEQTNAHIFLLTLGEKGAQLLRRDGECLEAFVPSGLQVVDTVGAGDCFFAGFLASWLRSGSQLQAPSYHLQAALHHAVHSASISVTRQGCQPPTRDEIKAIIEGFAKSAV